MGSSSSRGEMEVRIESARGDLHAAPRMWDMRFAGVFIYDGGAQKTLTIYWAFSPID